MLIEKRVIKKSNIYPAVKAIYKEAFPKKERFLFAFFEKRASDGKADFYSYWFEDILVGFTYALKNENYVYVFYLAVKKEERGKGYGREILNQIKEKYKDGDLYVSFWNGGDDYAVMTQDELDEYIENEGLQMGGM